MPSAASGFHTMATVAPRAAPADTPSRYGSASGLRKVPWNDAPAVESAAPATRARTMPGQTEVEQQTGSPLGVGAGGVRARADQAEEGRQALRGGEAGRARRDGADDGRHQQGDEAPP